MKKMLLSLAMCLSLSLTSVPMIEAQGRPGQSRSVERRAAPSRSGGRDANRPGNGASHGGSRRPGTRNPGNQTPGYQKPGGNKRPGNHKRPGMDNPGLRPGHDNNGHRPGAGHRPGTGVGTPPPVNNPGHHKPNPGHRPGNYPGVRPGGPSVRPGHAGRPPVMAPPHRPGRPIFHGPWQRPVPPRGWRPVYRANLVGNILGLTFGLTVNTALDALYASSYSIDGYGANEIYLRNVTEMNYLWPDATLYFDNAGGLVRSQFYDSSFGYNPGRFNMLYNQLMNAYGSPASFSNGSNVLSATWFGYNGDYISLQYKPLYTPTGYRNVTVLTIGR